LSKNEPRFLIKLFLLKNKCICS